MSRVQRMLIALGLAFALPALTAADGAPQSSAQAGEICATAHQSAGHLDDRWQWRLRAYRHLDCVTATIDDALARPGGTASSDHIVISRDALERIRTHAWWARDAAARIGH